MGKQDPVFNYYPETGVESAGPIFNIQAGANGELYAEQDPNLQDGDYPCPPSVFPVNYHEEQEEQVDENYDPTDFLQGLVPGEVVTPTVDQGGDYLQDDLAISDDSDDDGQGDEDDPMAF